MPACHRVCSHRFLLAMPAGILSSLLAACAAEPLAEGPHTTPPFEFAPFAPTAPLVFFERACSNCHGPYGMFYSEGFVKGEDDAALCASVRAMVTGQGQSTLDPVSLEALIAFHRSLRARPLEPFVVVTAFAEGKLSGEAHPGTQIRVFIDDAPMLATTDGFMWNAVLPADWERAQRVLIVAESGDREHKTELDAAAASFSHRR